MNWNEFGKKDPFHAILTYKGKENGRWELDEFFEHGKREVERLMRDIHSLQLNFPRGKALDFGCGVGRLTQALTDYFDEVYGIDIAPSMIALARKYNRHRERCKYLLNKTDDLNSFSNDEFHFIYSNITLQHMHPQYSKNYIKEFVRILSPEGLLIFQLPNPPKQLGVSSTSFRKRVLSKVPSPLLRLYRQMKIRWFGASPVMQLYGVGTKAIATLLKENGGEILNLRQEPMGEEGWTSCFYFVKKKKS